MSTRKTKKAQVEKTTSRRVKARGDASWSPAVSRELNRLELACKPFDPPGAPRPLDGFGSFLRPGRNSWRGVDPEDHVRGVPPAIWAFLQSRRTPRRFMRSGAGPSDYVRMAGGGAFDVVVNGARRVLVTFAVETKADFLLDLLDQSPDPAVWSAWYENGRISPPVFRIAYAKLSSFLATFAADGARPDQMPPWAPEVTAELTRLRAIVLPYDANAPRPVSVGCSFATGTGSWEDVDPQGQVTEVPPAVFCFLSNVDFRTKSLQLVRDDDKDTLKFQRGNENFDRVVKGKRRLLVSFAINETYFQSCLDLCDESPDPAVWWVDYGDCGVQFERLSQFLAALRS
jgi:hypothetical protein